MNHGSHNFSRMALLAHRSARWLAIVYSAGLSIFALDVFQPGKAVVSTVIELIIHISPSLLIAFLLAATWKKPMVASIMFLGVAVLFTLFFHTYRSWALFGLLTVPLLFPAGLFFLAARTAGRASAAGSDVA
jgi:hypothetical protein